MLARRQLRMAVLEALRAGIHNTVIVSPGDWETPPGKLPEIKLRCGNETKTPSANQVPAFTTSATLELFLRVDGETAEHAQERLEVLCDLVETTVMGNAAFIELTTKLPSINTRTEIKSDGQRHLAGCLMAITCETFELFNPDFSLAPPLDQVFVNVDTQVPFDATGTYPSPPFPASVEPAPRATGPDGRDEGQLQINLTS